MNNCLQPRQSGHCGGGRIDGYPQAQRQDSAGSTLLEGPARARGGVGEGGRHGHTLYCKLEPVTTFLSPQGRWDAMAATP